MDLYEKEKLEKALTTIIEYVSTDKVDDHTKEVVTSVISEYKERFDIFLVSHIKNKIFRLQRLLERLDRVEEILFSDDTIASADTRELLSIHNVITNSIRDIVDLVLEMKDTDVRPIANLNIYNIDNQQIVNTLNVVNKDSRKKINHMLDLVLSKAKSVNLDSNITDVKSE